MQDTAVRDTERSGQALRLGAWSQSVALRSRRLSEAKVRKLRSTEEDGERWREFVNSCLCEIFFSCFPISFIEDK